MKGLPVTDVSICSRETMSKVRSNFSFNSLQVIRFHPVSTGDQDHSILHRNAVASWNVLLVPIADIALRTVGGVQ